MHGFIHLLLEAFVSETVGSQHLRPIRRMAGIDGPPLAIQYYPDEMTTRLLQAISEYEGIALDDVLYQFGVYFMCAPLMHKHYRAFLEGYTSARTFLEQVTAIHRHLGQSLKGALLPELRYVHHGPELLEIIYNSPRHLCRFLQGVLDGVGQYFNETLEVREMECQLRGASACRVLVRFLPARRSDPPEHPSPARARASGPQGFASATPSYPFAPPEASAAWEAKRQREEDEDVLILHTLSFRQAAASPLLQPGAAPEPPLHVALSLFEIVQWLTARGVPTEYTRLSLIQRSLTRLAVQGFVEVKVDPQATRQSASPGVAALGGQGILAAQRYRITQSGLAWLNDMQQRQGH